MSYNVKINYYLYILCILFSIYQPIDFDGDGEGDNIRFMIKRIKVHTSKALKDTNYRFPGNYGVEKFLEIFSGNKINSCLQQFRSICYSMIACKISSLKINTYWIEIISEGEFLTIICPSAELVWVPN